MLTVAREALPEKRIVFPSEDSRAKWRDHFGSAARPQLLKIENGLGHDAYVKLKYSLGGRTALSFIVKARSTANITNISDGKYDVNFAMGSNFSHGCGNFAKFRRALVFDRPANLTSSSTAYTAIEYTLHPVPEGMASTHEIDFDQFDAD